jgi:hypothetical protein
MAQTLADLPALQAMLEQQYAQQQQEQKSFSDRLKERRAGMEQFADIGAQRLQDGNTPGGIPLSPDVIYDTRSGFRQSLGNVIQPMEQQYQQSQQMGNNLFSQIVELAQQQQQNRMEQSSNQSLDIDKLLSRRDKLQKQGLDTSIIDQELEQAGYGVINQSPEQLSTNKVAQLKSGEKKPITELTSALKDLKNIQEKLNQLSGSPTGLGSYLKGVTGPIATSIGDLFAGPSNEAKNLRADIDRLSENIRKDLYGSAFTETEKKVAFLPGSGKQEATNIERIRSMTENKELQLRSALKNAGLNDDEINSYLQSQGISITNANNPQIDQIKTKLKNAGYSDEEIQAYIKVKGL